MTTREAAELLGLTTRQVARLCKDKILVAKKHGRDWDIEPESVKRYAEAPKDKGGRPKKGI